MTIVSKDKFWQWAFSDLLSNALRGSLAEYIVGNELSCLNAQRLEWDAYDLLLPSGKYIEVKSAAYLQTWQQKKSSIIRFDIAEKTSWFAASNSNSDKPQRAAHIYVFCVFAETDRQKANPLDLQQWFFIVMSSADIAKHFGKNKTVGLSTLENAGAKRIQHFELCEAIALAEKQLDLLDS